MLRIVLRKAFEVIRLLLEYCFGWLVGTLSTVYAEIYHAFVRVGGRCGPGFAAKFASARERKLSTSFKLSVTFPRRFPRRFRSPSRIVLPFCIMNLAMRRFSNQAGVSSK